MNKLDSIKKKIKYRAGYRNIKEMDLLLKFVEKYIDVIKLQRIVRFTIHFRRRGRCYF